MSPNPYQSPETESEPEPLKVSKEDIQKFALLLYRDRYVYLAVTVLAILYDLFLRNSSK